MGDSFDDRDPLWRLLDHASNPEVRPNLGQRVLAEVRDADAPPSRRVVAFPRWALPLAAAACLALALVIFLRPNDDAGSGSAPLVADAWDESYIEAITALPEADDALEEFYYVDSLLAAEDVDELDEEAIIALLY